MKNLILAAAVLLLVLPSIAQPPTSDKSPNCDLANSPKLRGFYLGMKEDDAAKEADRLLWTPPVNGARFTSISPDELKEEHREHIRWIHLESLDGVIAKISVTYDDSIKWNNAREFAAAIFSGLNLPLEHMKSTSGVGDDKMIGCKGFHAIAEYRGGIIPTAVLLNPEMPGIIAARKKEAEEKKKKGFKP